MPSGSHAKTALTPEARKFRILKVPWRVGGGEFGELTRWTPLLDGSARGEGPQQVQVGRC
jgi:hypothetical protein